MLKGARLAISYSPIAVVLVLVAAPVVALISSWGSVDVALWTHLWNTQLPALIANTLLLMLGVTIGVLLFGVSTAWLVSACEFPGRKWLSWALVLPMAMPAYVLAFVVLGMTDFGSPLQRFLAVQFPGFHIDLRHPVAVMVVLSLVFYPYVFLLARTAFRYQGITSIQAARTLGKGPWKAFFSVVLPMARPAIAAGLALALMETLADFGAVSVFNYQTFTTAIYKSWSSFYSLSTATQLASLLLLLVALLLVLERFNRSGRFAESSAQLQRFKLSGGAKWLASLWCFIIFLCAFLLPVFQLVVWAWDEFSMLQDRRFIGFISNTVKLGVMAMLVAVVLATLSQLANFYSRSKWLSYLQVFASLGYALPGSVMAVGMMIVGATVDGVLARHFLMGSALLLILAYVARFYAVANGPIETAMAKIKPSLLESARVLGVSENQQFRRVVLPLLSPGVYVAALMVLVDVMKEMPATLLLRPFGWDTLAIKIFELTSEGEWHQASVPALMLVVISILPVVYLLNKTTKNS
ncbi:ABC transporter permease [Umboniibacter marinipuniceus]|uniref:Iron(III) transport system permease protein n=1 Tax=Umboniibacter marinipuniceus TaxID=569599 RepID=A0A3M0ABR3_9GAMM|nr:iron ABC transporter permease [Umboniibacter marinipuniceus]RMA80218.1 iron(III) transport system permease protein [Umboniibacter marinipuniceus]